MRKRLTSLAVLIFLSGCSAPRNQSSQATAFSPGSIGTSGGGDVAGLTPLYRERLTEINQFLESHRQIEPSFDTTPGQSTEYELLRDRLIRALQRLQDPDTCTWDFRETLSGGLPAVSFHCGHGRELTLESRLIWDGVANERFSYVSLLKLLARLEKVSASESFFSRLADEVAWHQYRGEL